MPLQSQKSAKENGDILNHRTGSLKRVFDRPGMDNLDVRRHLLSCLPIIISRNIPRHQHNVTPQRTTSQPIIQILKVWAVNFGNCIYQCCLVRIKLNVLKYIYQRNNDIKLIFLQLACFVNLLVRYVCILNYLKAVEMA